MKNAVPGADQGTASVSASTDYRNSDGEIVTDPAASAQITSSMFAEPIVIAKFWKSRAKREFVQVALTEYMGHRLIDLRIFAHDEGGRAIPTKKGISLALHRLPPLIDALDKAGERAYHLGFMAAERSS